MTSMDKFEEYKRLEAEATPGPWKADTEVRGDCVVWGPNGRFLLNAQAEPHWVPDPSGKERAVAFDADVRDVKFIAESRLMSTHMISAIEAAMHIYEKFDVSPEKKADVMYFLLQTHLSDEVIDEDRDD